MSFYQTNAALAVSPASTGISATTFASSVPRSTVERGTMHTSNGKTGRRVLGDSRNTSSRVSTREFTDWLTIQGQRYSEKELADLTGMSVKAAQNIRAGKSGGNGATIATWMLNDPQFAAALAEYVGLIRPGEAEFAGALTQAFNAYQRRK